MSKKSIQEVLAYTKADRRALPHVPDPTQQRSSRDPRST